MIEKNIFFEINKQDSFRLSRTEFRCVFGRRYRFTKRLLNKLLLFLHKQGIVLARGKYVYFAELPKEKDFLPKACFCEDGFIRIYCEKHKAFETDKECRLKDAKK